MKKHIFIFILSLIIVLGIIFYVNPNYFNEYGANVWAPTIVLSSLFLYAAISGYLRGMNQRKQLDFEKKKRKEEEIKRKKRIQDQEAKGKLSIKRNKIRLNKKKDKILSKFDKDNNGKLDLIEVKNDFNKLLMQNEKIIVDKGKEYNQNYIQQFIKVDNYLKDSRKNLTIIFKRIKEYELTNPDSRYKSLLYDPLEDFNKHIKIFENQVYTYNLILFHSFHLVSALVDDNQILFYNIYEKFDKLNIFNSNWENQVNDKLTDVNCNLEKLMSEIEEVGDRIVSAIDDLSLTTELSNTSLNNQFRGIGSALTTKKLLQNIKK